MYDGRAPIGVIDVTTTEFALNPLSGYNELRAVSPVSWQPVLRGFLLTRFKDIAQVLRSPALAEISPFRGWHAIAEKLGKNYEAPCRLFEYMPFIHGGERHRRLRAAIARGVSPFADAVHVFDRVAQDKLKAARRNGGLDLAHDFARPLLFEVLCELMGIAEEARPQIEPLTHLSFALDSLSPVRLRDSVARTISACMDVLILQVRESLRRHEGTLLHTIHAALPPDEVDRLTATAHLVAVMFLMGTDPLAGCIAFAVRHLLTAQAADPEAHQSQWATLSDDAMRFASTVDYLTRVALSDLSIGDFRLRCGERIVASPLAANHDPAIFGPDAGIIKQRRRSGVGMTFGAGAHVCVGARISRNVMRSAFHALSDMPQMTLAHPGRQSIGKAIRSLESLPVDFH